MEDNLPWRPIAECPSNLRRATVFDPDNAYLTGPLGFETVVDERIVTAERHDDGVWWVDHYQGGDAVKPTHFLAPVMPEGFPASVDPNELRAQREAAALKREHAFAASRAAAVQEQDTLEASYERYWAEQVEAARKLREP